MIYTKTITSTYQERANVGKAKSKGVEFELEQRFEKYIDKCNHVSYNASVIKNFRHRGLENLFYTGAKSGVNPVNAQKILDVLDRLDASKEIKDMNFPGSNLHKLAGKRKEQWAIKVTGNWRIVFEFSHSNAYDVDYLDYH